MSESLIHLFVLFLYVIISNIDTAGSSTVEKIEKYITNRRIGNYEKIHIYMLDTYLSGITKKNIPSSIFGNHFGNDIEPLNLI